MPPVQRYRSSIGADNLQRPGVWSRHVLLCTACKYFAFFVAVRSTRSTCSMSLIQNKALAPVVWSELLLLQVAASYSSQDVPLVLCLLLMHGQV